MFVDEYYFKNIIKRFKALTLTKTQNETKKKLVN